MTQKTFQVKKFSPCLGFQGMTLNLLLFMLRKGFSVIDGVSNNVNIFTVNSGPTNHSHGEYIRVDKELNI